MAVLLQTAIHCGVPAAVSSFRLAREAFDEMEKDLKNLLMTARMT
jgi:alkylhydroperoxidase/carboxymuconolactone decarboxylase family protein YurZ